MEEKMNIDDIMDFLDENPEGLEKIFINFDSQLLEIASSNVSEVDVVDFIYRFFTYSERKNIVKEIIDTL
jgi:RNA binding exosome subunit